MQVRDVVVGLVMLLLGVCVGLALQPAHAQGQGAGAWELQSGAFGQQSFYAIRFNRRTGEAWVLSGERGAQDDAWLQLPEEKLPNKK